eukprot:scaffold4376_cov117-Isochrysis_galbana.AAC.2
MHIPTGVPTNICAWRRKRSSKSKAQLTHCGAAASTGRPRPPLLPPPGPRKPESDNPDLFVIQNYLTNLGTSLLWLDRALALDGNDKTRTQGYG